MKTYQRISQLLIVICWILYVTFPVYGADKEKYEVDESVPETIGPFFITIHLEISQYVLRIELLRVKPLEHEDWRYGISRLIFSDAQTNTIIQIIEPSISLSTAAMMQQWVELHYDSAHPILKEKSCPIEFLDMNFDGYLDFRIFLFGGTGGALYAHYLFTPETSQFMPFPALDKEREPSPDPETQTIVSFSSGGHAGHIYVKKVFTFEQKHLILVQYERQEYDREHSQYIRTTETFKDGKKVTSRVERISPHKMRNQ